MNHLVAFVRDEGKGTASSHAVSVRLPSTARELDFSQSFDDPDVAAEIIDVAVARANGAAMIMRWPTPM